MNCKKARILSQELLDEEITEEAREALLAHLACCPSCMRFYRENQKLKKLIASLPTPQLSPSFNSLVLRKIHQRERKTLRPFLPLRLAKRALLFLLPLALLIFIFLYIHAGRISEEALFDTYRREHLIYTLQNPLISGDSVVKILLISGEE